MTNWQQIAQGEPNPFDVVRTTTDGYQANYDEFVITDQDSVQLPAPQANAAVAIRGFEQNLTVSTPSGNIWDYGSSVTTDIPQSIIFVSDGTDWYIQSREDISAIPDGEIHYHPGDEGSGTTIDDQVGSADISLSADDWVSVSEYKGGVGFNLDHSAENAGTAQLTQPTARTRIVRCIGSAFGSDQTWYIWGHGFAPAVGYLESNEEWRFEDANFDRASVSESVTNATDAVRILVSRMDASTQYFGVYDNSYNLIGEDSRSNPDTSYDSSTFYLGRQGNSDRWWEGSVDPNLETFDRYLSDSEVQTVLEQRF